MKELVRGEQELRDFKVTEFVTFRNWPYLGGSHFTEALNGRTPEELVSKVPENVYAFSTHNVVEASVTISGEKVSMRSEPFGHSKNYYIDGKLWTLEELKHVNPLVKFLIPISFESLRKSGAERVVQLRGSMGWEPFFNGDRIIHSKPINARANTKVANA